MAEWIEFLPVFIGGMLLGAIFFGGLWWTTQRGVGSERPALWFGGSYILRTGICLAGFFFLADGRLSRLMVGLLGCLVARHLVMRLVGPTHEGKAMGEAGHAA